MQSYNKYLLDVRLKGWLPYVLLNPAWLSAARIDLTDTPSKSCEFGCDFFNYTALYFIKKQPNM